MKRSFGIAMQNTCTSAIIYNMVLAAIALFINGLGVFLTIRAGLGAAPWDVLNMGFSKTFGILYGNASVAISFTILIIDILMREPIGIAMFIDAVVVGKAVDFFNYIDVVPVPKTLFGGIAMIFVGLVIIAYTQYLYMIAALGCGPRDTLLVGLKKRITRLPIGIVSIIMLAAATLIGFILGGKVGVGTIICAFCAGPILQFAFYSLHLDATQIKHQNIFDSFKIFRKS